MKRIARNLFKHENGTYYTISRINGKQVKRSLGTGDKSLAKQIVKQNRLNLLGNIPSPAAPPSRPIFLDAVEEHEDNSAFASPKTACNLRTRKRTMLRFCQSWDNFSPVAIWKQFEVEGWVAAPNQLRWYLRSLSAYFVERGWISPAQVSGKIPGKVVPPRRIQIPSADSVKELLLMCEAEDFELGQFIRWLTNSGLRLAGAAGIRWEDIDFSAGEYRRRMKGGKVAVIPLLPDALSLLKSRCSSVVNPKTGLVFSLGDARIKRVRRILRKYAVGLGLNLEHPHLLRHHFASVAFANGFSPGEVALMLGHRDGGTLALQVYGHVIPSQLKSKVSNLKMVA